MEFVCTDCLTIREADADALIRAGWSLWRGQWRCAPCAKRLIPGRRTRDQAIIRAYLTGKFTQQSLADHFRVSQPYVSVILKRHRRS